MLQAQFYDEQSLFYGVNDADDDDAFATTNYKQHGHCIPTGECVEDSFTSISGQWSEGGADLITNGNANSAEECQTACLLLDSCAGFDYHETDKTCIAHTADSIRTRVTFDSEWDQYLRCIGTSESGWGEGDGVPI